MIQKNKLLLNQFCGDKGVSVGEKSYSNQTYQDRECVMEIKAPISCDDDDIQKLINHSTSRFSKYSRGLKYISGNLQKIKKRN